jgi:zinc protease
MTARVVASVLPTFLVLTLAQAQLAVKFERFSLPNGLEVILHEDHSVPVVSCNMWYHVGSANEKPGRTGFAHLFEHVMFEGSGHVPVGMFDEWLEAAGGQNNASTSADRTNYWENVPSNALELALFLESDRAAHLIDAMTPAKLDAQRDVVKNERRESYENQPYGMASILLDENIYPPDHPYHWPTIGSMEDLTAASFDDVVEFFRKYYVPNNASLAIAGDIDPARTKALVQEWFSDVPRGKPVPPLGIPPASITQEKRLVHEDKVQLPRLYISWITPRHFAPGDAELDVLSNILTGSKNARLFKRLVYDLQIAQDVSSGQESSFLGSKFSIVVTARAGHTLAELEEVVREELQRIKDEPPTLREVQRAVNGFEANFLDRLEQIGGFGGKADQLNAYFTETGNPDYFNEDLSRYRALSPEDIRNAARTFLRDDGNVVLSIVPEGKRDLAAPARQGGVK